MTAVPLKPLALLALVLAPGARAQDAETATEVYVAYFKIGFADLPQWIADYHETSVPILDELVEEGLIVGYGSQMHHTGGEYNVRQAFRGTEETDFDAFWAAFLTRSAERHPDVAARSSEMIQAHKDEIWEIQELSVGDGTAPRYFHDAQFQIGFADLEEWDATWDAVVKPVFEKGVEDGLIVGWVEEGHNTGGRFNWKILTLSTEWDTMDDFQARIFEAVPPDHALWGLIRAHDDVIWATLPPPEQ